nr:MBL fold metallo-hydrolase [Pedobacter panaciterrae]
MANKSVFGNVSVKGKQNNLFTIKQFEDKGLAHFSYAILADKKIVLVDPSRDPKLYYDFAVENNAKIIAVIETHPHADFVSSHLEIYQKEKSTIYASKLVNAAYPHQNFDDGDSIKLSKDVILNAINTPGHSPDSISIVLQEKGKNVAVFTGDALLFGSVGRPDLREYSGGFATERKKLAGQMYHTVHQKYAALADEVLVYPAHGAGSLCGNAIRDVKESTIGYEKVHNFAFQDRTEQEFVDILLSDQPYIPEYFPYDVELNKKGAEKLAKAIFSIPILTLKNKRFEPTDILIDTRESSLFRKSHFRGAINIIDGGKFETWLGTIVKPNQKLYLIANSEKELQSQFAKAAKIGYEVFIKEGLIYGDYQGEPSDVFDEVKFLSNKNDYVILDVRTVKEASADKIFENAINIPLSDLKNKIDIIPKGKPIVVHCASGYRSGIGASIIKKLANDVIVYDLGDKIKQFVKL